MIIGSEKEQQELRDLLDKEESQFCAVYGRRRVGKTYLVRETFHYQFCFQHGGRKRDIAATVDGIPQLTDSCWNEVRHPQDLD